MNRRSINSVHGATVALGLVAGSLTMAASAGAQTSDPATSLWRIGASTGGYVASSALIRASDLDDTRLGAGPAFSVEPQYSVSEAASVFLSGVAAFGNVRLGSSIQPAAVGPSNEVTLASGTAGVVFAPDWLGGNVQPTFRVGGGFKWYRFDLVGAENQLRPTTDFGLGLRGVGMGAVEGTAELRYMLSSFDQSKLPTQGIAPQDQRQHDFAFFIGIGIRP